MAAKTLSWPQRLFLGVLCAADLPPLCIFARSLWRGTLDPTLFTYIANIIIKLCSALLLCALANDGLMRLYAIAVLPLHVQTAFDLALVLVALVFQDGGIYTRVVRCDRSDEAAWAQRFGAMHTQDFFVHSWPAIAALLVLLALQRVARAHVRAWLCTPARRYAYGVYCVCAGLLPYALFAAAVDWRARYSVPAAGAIGNGAVAVGTLVVGAVYWLFVAPERHRDAVLLVSARPRERIAAEDGHVWPAVGAAFARSGVK